MDRSIKAALASAFLLLPTYASAQEQMPTSDTPLAQALEFHKYFNMPENRVKTQFPSPESLYAWQHLSQYYPTARVARGGAISELEVAIDESIGKIKFKGKGGVDRTVSQHFEDMPLDAMIVLKDGKIVYERYKTMAPDTAHITMSCSKVFSSTLLAMLEDEGKVDLSKPVTDYVPEIRGSAWEQATVRNVMNMSSGLDIEETIANLLNPQSWIANWFTAGFELNKGDFREMSRNAKPLPGEPAGRHFRCSGANTQTLVLATQYVSGKRWQTLWNERVWSKIGAKNAFITGLAQDGTPLCAGMHNTTPEDLLRFTLLYPHESSGRNPSMNNTINPMLTKLCLSGMSESLEVRLHEASSQD